MSICRVSRPAMAAVAAAVLGLGVGGVGPAASAAGSVPVSAGLPQAVSVEACSRGYCHLSVDEGAVGFPVAVSTDGASAAAGAAPDGAGVVAQGVSTSHSVTAAGPTGSWSFGWGPGAVAPGQPVEFITGPAGSAVAMGAPESCSVPSDPMGLVGMCTGAVGVALGDGTLNWASTYWGITVGGTYTDLASVAGSYNLSADEYYFTLASLTGGGGSPVTGGTVDVGPDYGLGQSYDVAISSSGTFTVDGLTYTLGAGATNGDTFSATLSPQSTTYTFTPASGGAATASLEGQVTSGTSVTVGGSGTLTFTVGTTVPSTNRSVTIVSGTTSYLGTPEAPPPLTATIDVSLS